MKNFISTLVWVGILYLEIIAIFEFLCARWG